MEVFVVFYNERNCNIAGIFKSYDDARQLIDDGNGEYIDVIDKWIVK